MRASFKAIVAAGLALGASAVSAVPVNSYGGLVPSKNGVTGPIATFDYASNADGSLINQGTGISYLTLANIGSLTLTVTIRDGDTATGNFDFNDLSIGLNGLDTGIKLNTPSTTAQSGFPNNSITTLDVSGVPQNAAAILTAIRANAGKATLSIFDNDVDLAGANASGPSGDEIAFPDNIDAVLQLREGTTPDTGNLIQKNAVENNGIYPQVAEVTAVPLPVAAYIAPLGAGLAGIYSRRFRRQK
jgi:hypothetical protein